MGEEAPDRRSLGQLTSDVGRALRLSHFTIEASPDLIIWLEQDGHIVRVNRAVYRALAQEPGAFRGLTIGELLTPDALERWQAEFDGMVTRQGAHLFESEMRAADGRIFPVEVALSLFEVDGQVQHCAFIRDISERKRTEVALRDALNELQELQRRLEAENVYLQAELQSDHGFEDVVGQSIPIREVMARVSQVASSPATVLILGESGTGKELLARAVHQLSSRRERALVKVNCAALPATLMESELFGHERGAFTSAVAQRIGRFELADGGTLFLDEVGELPLELQAKLLRVLQEGEFERLGSTQTRKVDVRIIAATNQDLAQCVEQRRFRADLFYRLNVFPILAPALRERAEDVPLLAEHFLRKFSGEMGKEIPGLSKAMLASLVAYSWPGNVRELQNVVERAVILHQGQGPLDQALDVPAVKLATTAAPRTLREMEIELMIEALEACDWVVGGKQGAARRLDIPASTLRERMARYGITRKPG